MVQTVKKRDGRIVGFSKQKVIDAIRKAMLNTEKGEDEQLLEKIASKIAENGKSQSTVNEIQDMVELELMRSSRKDVAKEYISYRNKRDVARKAKTSNVFIDIINAKNNDITRENANMNADTPAGMMMKFASETSKEFAMDYLMSEKTRNALEHNYIHIHDLDYMPSRSLTCLGPLTNLVLKDESGNVFYTKMSYFDKYFDENDQFKMDKYHYIMGRNGWTRIMNASRRHLTEDDRYYFIKTRKGFGLNVTGNHRVPVIDAITGLEELKFVDDINVGDKLLKGSVIRPRNDEYIDIIQTLSNIENVDTSDIFITNIKKLKKWLDYKYDITNVSKEIGSTTYRNGESYLTVEQYKELDRKYSIDEEVKNTLSVKVRNGKDCIPFYLPITNDLATVIGYIHSEGSVSYLQNTGNYQLVFSNTNQLMIDKFNSSFERIFPNNLIPRYLNFGKERVCNGSLSSSKLLVYLFKYAFGKYNGSSGIYIPSFIMNGSDEIKWSYISALIDGDGHIKSDGTRVVYATVSEELANNLITLFDSLGITSRIKKIDSKGTIARFGDKEVVRNFDTYYITVYGKENVTKFKESLVGIKRINDAFENTAKTFKSVINKPEEIIEKVEISKSDEYVYDLETVEHWFEANGYIVHNCVQHPLDNILTNGFYAGHGASRPAKRIETAAALACISMETAQNEMHGGQAIPAFDFYMAPYVRMSYKEELKKAGDTIGADLSAYYDAPLKEYEAKPLDGLVGTERALQMAMNETVKRVHQAMEAFIHNMNSIHCVHGDEKLWVMDEFDCRFKPMTIRDVVDNFREKRFKVLSINKEGKLEWKYIYDASYQGQKDVYTVLGKGGRKVHVTDNHRISTSTKKGEISFDVPKNISNFIVPMIHIPVTYDYGYKWDITKYKSRKTQNYTLPYIPVTAELCELLGMYVADGSVVSESQLSFAVCDEEINQRLIHLMKKVYNEEVTWDITYYSKPKLVHDIRFNVGKVWANNFMDICGGGAKKKQVPFFILGGTQEMQRTFIRGYMLCDGSIKAPTEGYYNASSISKTLIDGLDLLYLMHNEYPYRHDRQMTAYGDKTKLGNMSYEISFSGQSNEAMRLGLDVYAERVYRKFNKEFSTEDYFVEDIESVELFEENAAVYDISVEDNENFLTCDNVIIHNSRGGNQVVFSSINYGTDTSAEGRCVMREILLSTYEGVGNGETAIFPIQIWKKKRGVNYLPEDPNYDLYQLACKVTARRFFPNFLNLDASYNQDSEWKADDPKRYEHEVATMGCVDGDTIIGWRDKDHPEGFKATFLEFWNEMSGRFEAKHQSEEGYEGGWFIDLKGIDIQDRGGWAECLRVNLNPNKGDWMKVTLSDGKSLTCTSDHVWEIVGRGSVRAKDVRIGDRVYTYAMEIPEVVAIEDLGDGEKSYDVTTVTEHFMANDVYTHNCRTRVFENRFGPKTSIGRGNLSFTTINIVKLAIECMDVKDEKDRIELFFSKLDEQLDIAAEQLNDRYQFQKQAMAKQFPLLMKYLWIGADKLKPEDKVDSVINQGTLGIGFIGLAECLVALIGKHHGESEKAQELGLRIVTYMRDRINDFCERYHHNFSVLATPAEGLSGKFTKKDKKEFGIIKGVTDRDYYTNSSHVPVYYKCTARHKAEVEAPYHKLERGGHIFYVEIDGDATHNPQVISRIVDMMDDLDMGYGSVNHNRNRCMDCGYENADPNMTTCPKCGGTNIDKLQRITG